MAAAAVVVVVERRLRERAGGSDATQVFDEIPQCHVFLEIPVFVYVGFNTRLIFRILLVRASLAQ